SLAWAGKNKKHGQYIVGFALETENDLEQGKGKLKRKQCDMIVVNNALTKDSGFGSDNNTITIVKKNDDISPFPHLSKSECAKVIFESIINDYASNEEL
ncbi:MAG: phosphopantothenoylcysteine decarboxylase, partial [Candidatus Kapaibacterium sp.]